MDVLLGEGVRAILWLQNTFASLANEMLFLSHVGDPKNSFLFYFPVTYHMDKVLGVMVLWVAVLSEWINLVLKWFLRGERPYWWVNETDKYKDIKLSQYPLTCETGPGSPSGHAMVTTAVLFTMLPFMLKQIDHQLKTPLLCRMFRCFAWLCFVVIVSLVSLSRIFIATHFPHQVIVGVVGGIAISYAAQNHLHTFMQMNCKKCIIVSYFLLLSTLAIYAILSYAIFDPSQSVQKAQKWCVNPAYIHIETRPFYALVRDAGAVFGIGLAHWLNTWHGLNIQSNMSKSVVVVEIILSLLIIQVLNGINLSFSADVFSYLLAYFKSVFLVVLVIFGVPASVKFVKQSCKSKSKSS